jgi:thioredoxin reductase (NADPH)
MTNGSFNDVDLEARRPVAEPEHRVSLVQAGRFPVLDAAQLALLRAYGTEQELAAGEVLFAEGDETYDLIVVLDGEVQIVGCPRRPEETVIATYGPGHFLGEIGLLTGQRAFATAVARTAGRILRVPAATVRAVMAQEPGLSELLLRTFLIRHGNLTTMGAGLTLIGSRFDADTRRILEVLSRKRLPARWLDLEEALDGRIARTRRGRLHRSGGMGRVRPSPAT